MDKILVVEDDQNTRFLLRQLLKKEGYEVFEAIDGEQALAVAQECLPDVVLLDVNIPGLNGFDVCTRLRQDCRYSMSYIIFLTARTNPKDLSTGLEFGGDDYITKPFNVLEVTARIKAGLRTLYDRKFSTYDPLTGLYNRHFFNNFLQQEVSRSLRYHYPLSLVLIDIDHFKKVNDTYGHMRGDMVLQEIADQLIHFWRKTDVVARWGGEEFVMVLPNTDAEGARISTERIRTQIEQMHFDEVGTLTISAGIAQLAGNEFDFFTRADQALYKAKQQGRNQVVLG